MPKEGNNLMEDRKHINEKIIKPKVSGEDREKIIIKTSIIGVIINILLAVTKALVGLSTKSIAITLDAVNNLSDVLSSLVTIIGAKLAGKAPDREHPFGHGRIEYMSQLLVAMIILYAGITAFIESVKKIVHPESATYTKITFILLTIAIITKIYLGTYVKNMGKSVNSGTLTASGKDALFDGVISTSVLISALVFITTGFSLEAYVGVFISAMIMKAGIEIISEAISETLGTRIDSEFSKSIKDSIMEVNHIHGAYDLVLNNYGPNRFLGSVHIEVNDTMTAKEIDKLTRILMDKIYKEHNVILTAVGIYSKNTGDNLAFEIERDVRKIAENYHEIIQIHGFYADTELKTIVFDVILDYETMNKEKILEDILLDVLKLYPDFSIRITPDYDVID